MKVLLLIVCIAIGAHCLVDESDKVRHNLRVVSGTAEKYLAGTVRKIQHLFIAPGFDLHGIRNDIAVIVLSHHVTWNNEQQTIPLPSEELNRYGKAYLMAFASTDDPWQNTLLHEIQVKIRPIDFCIGYDPIDDHRYSGTICGLNDYYERPYMVSTYVGYPGVVLNAWMKFLFR